MMIQAVLGNPHHPEYGVATIPLPIPRDQYAHCMELLEALEIGDAVKADCKVEKVDSFYTVLKRTEMLTVNVEELNYLAKRLDSFDTGEAAQFQAMAHKLELFELKDLINLTFCCQQATVITDFSDLDAVGRDHYMNLHGGSASVDGLNALDGKETARQLIESDSGTITPYGVVYDNGMKLEQIYDGRFFPCYYSTEVPAEFRYHIEEMRTAFSLLDSAVASVNGQTESGNGLDPIRIKAVFYSLCFGEDAPSARAASRFVECFYTWETRTRTVDIENGDGTVTSTVEESAADGAVLQDR